MAEEEEYEEEEDEVSQNNKVEASNEIKNQNPEPVTVQKSEDKKEIQSKKTKSSKKSNTKAKSKKNEKIMNDKAYILPTPENVISTRAFLESTVTAAIQEALLDLARKRDQIEDPLLYVGEYLVKKAKERK